jgi:hypothetical protein
MADKGGVVTHAADALANKIYEGIQFFFESKIDALVDILPELAGLSLIICGVVMMFGDLRKWLGRTGVVAIIGTTLVVIC